ncbi:uncharacterized protein LOC126897900 [Daktulosphaira vitifoliae]|uniref:uncharacterized protein LOC126897900 n=1 Tax=Daktulosphaira vitifoliae TaxID=58002 RepID=UPI0021AAD811|nr:uncharacterized protein LOC126897900 [Daktulosphaira vitifoliae]
MNIDLDWEIVRNAVNKAAATSIGELKRSRNTWYNDICRVAVDRRRKSRNEFIKNNTQMTKDSFIRERKACKSTLQREKRKFFSNILQTAENDHTQGRTRNFFRVIKQYGCEAWTTTKQTERNLRTFEHRVWRKICEPVIDETTGSRRRRYNSELYDMLEIAPVTSFIKGQRIQWLGHIARRRENEITRVALEWKPQEK